LRISTNGAYYLKELSALLFFTSYNVFEESVYSPWISFVDVVMPAMVAISSIVKSMYWLLGTAGLGLVITGMVVEFRRGKILCEDSIFVSVWNGNSCLSGV